MNGQNSNMNMNNGGIANFIHQIQEFKKTFTGNPRDEVQRLLNSGRMTQQQFNEYSQIAQQVMNMMGNR